MWAYGVGVPIKEGNNKQLVTRTCPSYMEKAERDEDLYVTPMGD
jgi:hypothetical protein